MTILYICVGGAIGLAFLYWLQRKTGWNEWGIGICLGGIICLIAEIFSIVNPPRGVESHLLAEALMFLLGIGFLGLGIWVIRKWSRKK